MTMNERNLRVNILALPNQQIVLVLMLAFVIFGTLLAISSNGPPWLFLLMALLLLALSFRRMLTQMEADVRKHGIHQAGPKYAPLQQRLINLCHTTLRMQRVPLLAIATTPSEPHALATWRRWYVVLGREWADGALQRLADPAQALQIDDLFLHELHHLKHGDHLWIGYANALLHTSTRLILWLALLLFGIETLTMLMQYSFFTAFDLAKIAALFETLWPGHGDQVVQTLFTSPEEFKRLAAQARNTDFGIAILSVLLNTLPYLVINSMLQIIYWQRLMRLREVYADAGVILATGRVNELLKGLISRQVAPNDNVRQKLWKKLQDVYRHHIVRLKPTPKERISLLQAPECVNGPAWAYGLLVGSFVLGLYLLMTGTTAVMLVGSWPMHFPVLATIVLIGLYLLIPLVLGQPIARPLWSATLSATLPYELAAGVVLITLNWLYLINPVIMVFLVETWTRIITWSTTINGEPIPQKPGEFLITATVVNLLQLPVVLISSLGGLWLITRLAQRMLTWYSLPDADRRLMPLIVAMIGWVVALVALVLLPPITDLVLLPAQAPANLSAPLYWWLASATLAISAALAGGWWWLDRRYAGRCPGCSASVPGPFALGKRCPGCGELLHPWLSVVYTMPPYRGRKIC